MAQVKAKSEHRPIHEIAVEIEYLWDSLHRSSAFPYWKAMLELRTKDDKYILESATSIILYFLSNASKWRGADARRLKQELKDILSS